MSEALEQLLNQTNFEAQQAGKVKAAWSNFRSPVLVWANGRIPSDGIALGQNNFGETTLVVTVLGATILKSMTPMPSPSEFTFAIKSSEAADSEHGATNAGIHALNEALTGLGDLRGCTVDAEASLWDYEGFEDTDEPLIGRDGQPVIGKTGRNAGKPLMVRKTVTKQLPYYKITRIQGAGRLASLNGGSPNGSVNSGTTNSMASLPVTQDDLDGISNFLVVEGVNYPQLTPGNVRIKLQAHGVNAIQPEIKAAIEAKTLPEFLADRTTPVGGSIG